jgi:hypothetical protein
MSSFNVLVFVLVWILAIGFLRRDLRSDLGSRVLLVELARFDLRVQSRGGGI